MRTHYLTMTLCSSLALSGCFASALDYSEPQTPQSWSAYESNIIEQTSVQDLKEWWHRFDDPVLNDLIDVMLKDSPERLIAQARIAEARSIKRTARSALFPQIGASADTGREDTGQDSPDNFYDARFDASYEIDLFGQNRKTAKAADAAVLALQAQYQDTTLSLIAELTRSYIIYRQAQKQTQIARKNLEIQEKTLELVKQQREFGESPQLDVERSETLVNTTRASISEFQRLAANARLQLTVLTGMLPGDVLRILDTPTANTALYILGTDVKPVLMAPADVLNLRPDIRAAKAALNAQTAIAEAAVASLFPTFTLSGFFGTTDNGLISSTNIWSVAIGAAVSLLDFGRIEGQIDTARAQEMVAFQTYRRTVLEAVTDVETALSDYAHINEERIALTRAYQNAAKAYALSQALYKEGETSFLDLLDAQRTLNEAESVLITSEAEQAESLIRIYKSLGVY